MIYKEFKKEQHPKTYMTNALQNEARCEKMMIEQLNYGDGCNDCDY